MFPTLSFKLRKLLLFTLVSVLVAVAAAHIDRLLYGMTLILCLFGPLYLRKADQTSGEITRLSDYVAGGWVFLMTVGVVVVVSNAINPYAREVVVWFFATVVLTWTTTYLPEWGKEEMEGITGMVAFAIMIATLYAWFRYDAEAKLGIFTGILKLFTL